MSDYKFDKEHLLDATNGGLDIILNLYPEADKKGGRWQHFGMSDADKTPSSIIYENGGLYSVQNFREGKNYSAFDIVMDKLGVEFGEAIKWVAATFGIDGQKVRFNTAAIEMKPATKSQKHGQYIFEYNNYLSDFELSVLGPQVTNKTALEFNLKSCKRFIVVKKYAKDHPKYGGKTMQVIIKSTEKYPIFVFDMGDWQKIYQPLHEDKGRRFGYYGDKVPHFLFGRELIDEYYQPLPTGVSPNSKTDLKKLDESYNKGESEGDQRADTIIIAGGDRDALNVASLGYPVVWKNSETEEMQYQEYLFLKNRCKNLVYVGDLDKTGVKETVKLALQRIDVKIAWLPEWLKTKKYRGKAQKDMTDFCKAVDDPKNPDKLKNQFSAIVGTALPARFWDSVYSDAGTFKNYRLNSAALFLFLNYQGFYMLEEDHDKDPFSFVRVENDIIRRVETHNVVNYAAKYLKETRRSISLLNFIHDTGKITEKKLSNIPLLDVEFNNCGKDHQYMYFKNEIWKITPEGVEKERYGNLDGQLWEGKILPHEVHISKNPIFSIEKKGGEWDIEIHKTDNHFFNFLINNSRVHWRYLGDTPYKKRLQDLKEADPVKRAEMETEILRERDDYREKNRNKIDEPGLPAELVRDQKLCLINKIFALGYAMHRYKTRTKAWIGFAMDYRISDTTASNGGSGKSIVWDQCMKEIFPDQAYIDGTNKKLMESEFVYGAITPQSDVVTLDDIDQYFPIRSLYNNATGDWEVNPKFGKKFTRKFNESPKAFITTNFGLFDAKDSTLRRLLINLHSDYYHAKNDDDPEQWDYKRETGVTLFEDFGQKEYSDFYNLMAQFCQFYLSTDDKIDPPMDHVEKRNSLQTMGDAFKYWADGFFTDIKKNRYVIKTVAMKDYEQNNKPLSSQKFKSKLDQWCKFYHFELNPQECHNTQGRVISDGEECIVIKTSFGAPINSKNPFRGMTAADKEAEKTKENGQVDMDDNDDDDVPF